MTVKLEMKKHLLNILNVRDLLSPPPPSFKVVLCSLNILLRFFLDYVLAKLLDS